MNSKSGHGYTKMKDGREFKTPPSSKNVKSRADSILEEGLDDDGHYYNIREDDESINTDSENDTSRMIEDVGNALNQLKLEPIDLEVSNRRKKLSRALASKRKK